MEPNQYENKVNLQNMNTLNKEQSIRNFDEESLQQHSLSHCFRDARAELVYRELIMNFSSNNEGPKFQHRLLVFTVAFFTLLGLNILSTLLIHIDLDLSGSMLLFKLLVVGIPSLFLGTLLVILIKNRGMRSTKLELLEVSYVLFVLGLILNDEELCEYLFEGPNDEISALASVLVLMYTSQFLIFVNYLRFMFWNLIILVVYIVVNCVFNDSTYKPILQSFVFLVAFAGCTISFYGNEQFTRLYFKKIMRQGIQLEDNKRPVDKNKVAPARIESEDQELSSILDRNDGFVPFNHKEEFTVLKNTLEGIGRDWNLNVFDIPNPIVSTGRFSMAEFAIFDSLSISEEKSVHFFSRVESLYKDNFYHNSIHAADVLSSFLYFVNNSYLQFTLSKIEVLGIIIASLAHDIAHPSFNNRFLINSGNKIAIKYNDFSVLEMMHASKTFKLLKEKQCMIIEHFSKEDSNYMRKLLIEMILATDMAKHFDLMKVFSSKEPKVVDIDVFKCGIKAADIGHSAKSWDLHFKWTVLLMKEFFAQGDIEKEQGLEVSFNCDRETTNIPKGQVGFIGAFVIPLYKVLGSMLGSEMIESTCVEHLNANQKKWELEFQDFKIE